MLPFLSTPQEAFVSHPWLSQPNVAGDRRSCQEVDAMTYYIFTTSKKFTEATAERINQRIKAIDDTAKFVGPLSIPGNRTKGWIERPNDGSNDYLHVRARNARMADIARDELGGET